MQDDAVPSPANATQRLGAFVARCARDPLLAPVAQKAAMCLLDALGLAIAARNERTATAMRSVASRMTATENAARIWVDGARVALSDAVLANGVAVHAHFQDDTDHNSWSHPGSLIVPVAVGSAEARDAPLDVVLRAIVAGYTAIEWLSGDETVARALIARGIRASPTFGTVGAAAAASVTLGLDTAKATNAVGIASSITGGILEPVGSGSDEWRLQNGHAGRGGLAAAQLADQGVFGAPNGLEGPKGFLRSLAGLQETPGRWRRDPDVNIMLAIMAKPWATLGDNMPVVAAAKLVHDSGVRFDQIKRIIVTMWRPYVEYPGTAFKGPFERTVQTQASSAFAASAMLVLGELTYDVALDRRADKDILRLVNLTDIRPHDGDALDASVEVELSDGTVVRREANQSPRGLIFQDRKQATSVFEGRLAESGFPAASARTLADNIFEAAGNASSLGIRDVLDALPQHK
jgi:2-methylcitrate dehydratase PrpD